MSTPCSSTIAKAFRVLGLFREHQAVTISLCQQELGIPRATAHRLLVSLREAGAVEQAVDGHYQLSVDMYELGAVAPMRRRLGDRCGNEIEALADRTTLRVHVAVRRDTHVLYIEAAHGERARQQGYRTRAGHRGPMHATALGKVLLAYAGPDIQDEALGLELLPYTPNTVTDVEQLRAELAQIRLDGYAFSAEQYVLGVSSVAVPFTGPQGDVWAAMSVVGDAGLMTRRRDELVAEAKTTAARITRGDVGTFRRRAAEFGGLVVSR